MPSPTLTLFELNSLVRLTIERSLSREYWVEAELSECRESRGHCYMELIQKEEGTATPIARASAKCWHSQWVMLQPYFERTTGQQLHAGMKVRLKVYAQFHEAFGFSWIVTDIDPTFTLGDMARRRQEIIRQLKEEGVFDLQKELSLPLFCQRIAVISSETAAGYGDFVKQLNENPYGLQFTTRLFPAVMQGEQVEQSIIDALNQIYEVPSGTVGGGFAFDCVVIIRGGGGTADMSGFDTLALAENVAQFPLPIITGIGHDRDESILDMVSFQRVKTPTAAAAFLVSHLEAVLNAIDDAQALIARLFSVVKSRQEQRIDQLFSRLTAHAQQRLLSHLARLTAAEDRLPLLVQHRLDRDRHRLELLGEKLKSLDPQLLLRRGYSITTFGGKALRDPAALKSGDEIVTRLEKGTIVSKVKK
ncbi:MAG: exodeoxyribonuclease VII large subunit [Prevotella sp.]|nr:exodeoxyribonuclease VII large subunit [Prevotella sp.]